MKLSDHKSPGKQGDAGLGVAIGWFAANGYTVCVPLTDSQEYDLVVENGNGFKKVQVKTSRFMSPYGAPRVELRTKCGAYKKVKHLSAELDFLFIVTDATLYLIPMDCVTARTEITLGAKYAQYKVSDRENC
jgi:hypothetical protein